MSKAAMQGECGNLKIRKTKEYLALVPFFGGLPPGVTKDFSKVVLTVLCPCPSPFFTCFATLRSVRPRVVLLTCPHSTALAPLLLRA